MVALVTLPMDDKSTTTLTEGVSSFPLPPPFFFFFNQKLSQIGKGWDCHIWDWSFVLLGKQKGFGYLGFGTQEGKGSCNRTTSSWKMSWGQFCSGHPQKRCTMSENGNVLKAHLAVWGISRFCECTGRSEIPSANWDAVVCFPPTCSIAFVFSSANFPFFLSSSSFHTHREPDASSKENSWNKYFGCILNQLSFVFHFLWLFTLASQPGFVWRGGCTLKP